MEISPLGDSAFVVRLDGNFERDPAAMLQAVLEAQRCLEKAAIPGLIECAPAYDTVGVFFDPAQVNPASLAETIGAVLQQKHPLVRHTELSPIEIPVCYEEEFAPDLAEVARHANLSLGEVVQLHSGVEYRVHCVGFMPGFGYLGGLPRELATPRRAQPRTRVPAGAVGIGGSQTGVYPTASPGGWNLIGRTPVRLFDSEGEPPTLLTVGARVRFSSIDRSEFERLSSELS